MALIGHPIVNDRRYTYGHATQMRLDRLRDSLAAASAAVQAADGEEEESVPCSLAHPAEPCVPDDADGFTSDETAAPARVC
jgi:hypothetical protein